MIGDYYRLAKPGIIYGNLLSLVAGYLFAGAWHISPRVLSGVVVGTALVIGSACVVNNYLDRDLDGRMRRTKQRALVTGVISSRRALSFAAALGIFGFGVLWLNTNHLTFLIGVIAWLDYVIFYDIAKRKTVHGTLVGTIAGSAPIVAGYTAVTNRFDSGALLLFFIMFAWQMAHFYAIAIYRAEDYQAAGVPVLPVVKSVRHAKLQILLYIKLFLLACLLLSVFGQAGYTFWLVMTVVSLYWLWRGWSSFRRPGDARWGRQMFGTSLIVLLVLCATLSVGSQLP